MLACFCRRSLPFAALAVLLPVSPLMAGSVSMASSAIGPALEAAAPAQSRSDLRKELQERLSKVPKNDADALYAVVVWAERKGLTSDAMRICRDILEIDPDHEKARETLGFVKHKDEWIKKAELERILEKEKEAEYKAKGWIKHKGEWIDPKHLRYAKLGFVQRDGKWLRADDAKRLDDGFVQHPRIGLWIRKDDLEKAEAGQFPIGNNRWVDLEAANQAHSTWQNPWVIVQDDFALASTQPLDEAEKLVLEASSALRTLKPILWESNLPLPRRFMLFVFTDVNDYSTHGAQSDDTGYSTYGAFYAPKHPNAPVAVNYAEQGWNNYYLRHGVGLGLSNVLFERLGIPPTSWLHTGIASYLERWQNTGHAQHFGRQYLAKGGVMNLKGFFDSFAINAEMTTDDMNRNIYQAGIVFSFLFNGGPEAKELRDAFKELETLIDEEKPSKTKSDKALKGFERAAIKSEDAIKAHLQKLVGG